MSFQDSFSKSEYTIIKYFQNNSKFLKPTKSALCDKKTYPSPYLAFYTSSVLINDGCYFSTFITQAFYHTRYY